MRPLIALLFLMSFQAVAESKAMQLSIGDKVPVVCPQGTTLKLEDAVLSCVCPEGAYASTSKGVLSCGTLCKIEEEKAYDTLDGETTWARFIRVTSSAGQVIYRERVYSPRSSEFEMIMREAKDVARKNCDGTEIDYLLRKQN